MCSQPPSIDGQLVACRHCNDCLKARKNGWVARCMAERSTSEHTYSITLTYNNETQENRDGSKVFRYKDVSNLLKRLRRQAAYHYGKNAYVRFVCAGENGDKKGRVHWHVLFFSNVPLIQLGKWHFFKNRMPVTEYEAKISRGKQKIRLVWSLWTHGLVFVQEPDQGGIAYAISYAMKDQFNIQNSKGTAREAKAENHSAGYFMQSRNPPIGWEFIRRKLADLYLQGTVPVSMKINIPEYSGYLHPTNTIRDMMLKRIYIMNQLIQAETGRSAPHFNTLLNSVAEQEKDWEYLINGEENPEEDEDQEEWERSILLRTKEIRREAQDRDTRTRCGKTIPCQRCVNSLSDEAFQQAQKYAASEQALYGSIDKADFARRSNPKCNPFCNYRDEHSIARAFPKSTRP